MYKVEIRNFKSIDELTIEIKPLTILIGPPASGKSNIMEALYPLGLLGKLYKIEEEYKNNFEIFCKNDSNFKNIWRVEEPEDIFPDYNYESPAEIELYKNNSMLYKAIIEADIDGLYLNYEFSINLIDLIFSKNLEKKIEIINKNIMLPRKTDYCFALKNQIISKTIIDFINYMNIATFARNIIEVRYYSFDKYNINENFENIVKCNINNYIINDLCKIPNHVLAESGINLAWRALRSLSAIRALNHWLEELGVGIEILTKKNPSIEFYEKPIEIKPNLVSEGIKRTLYYIVAVASAINYHKLKKINQFILLEEPEAHVYPYINNLFIEYLIKGLQKQLYFVISTHNPYFVDSIAEKINENDLSIYYIYKDIETRRTRAIRITRKTLMESKAYGPGDFLLMTPDELKGDVN